MGPRATAETDFPWLREAPELMWLVGYVSKQIIYDTTIKVLLVIFSSSCTCMQQMRGFPELFILCLEALGDQLYLEGQLNV
jgi:hypothetical protein